MPARPLHFQHVCLESLAYVVPEQVVTSADLERRLGPIYERLNLHEGRLELMTGIRQRRFWAPGTLPSQAAARAGRQALDNAGVRPEDVGLLVNTSVSRDCLEPATAAFVHRELGLSAQAGFYDISNACLGFLNGMVVLANMIELGQVRRGLVVAGESSRQLVETTIADLNHRPDLTRRELKDALASLTIGSGAAALLLAHDAVSTIDHRLVGGVVRAATQHNELCKGSADTGFATDSAMLMHTDSETLLNAGCELAGQTWREFTDALRWSADSIARCYTHQVGVAHRDRLYEVIGRDPAHDFTTFELFGNVGSVSLPLTMAMDLERQPPRRGQRLALLGIGSGLSCMMLGSTL